MVPAITVGHGSGAMLAASDAPDPWIDLSHVLGLMDMSVICSVGPTSRSMGILNRERRVIWH